MAIHGQVGKERTESQCAVNMDANNNNQNNWLWKGFMRKEKQQVCLLSPRNACVLVCLLLPKTHVYLKHSTTFTTNQISLKCICMILTCPIMQSNTETHWRGKHMKPEPCGENWHSALCYNNIIFHMLSVQQYQTILSPSHNPPFASLQNLQCENCPFWLVRHKDLPVLWAAPLGVESRYRAIAVHKASLGEEDVRKKGVTLGRPSVCESQQGT